MLLSSGCSFTAGQYGEHIVYKSPYPVLLAKKLDNSNYNIAQPGLDNTIILSSTLHYLLTFKSYNLPRPTYITVQLSDFFRKLLLKRTSSGKILPGRFSTQHKIRRHFTKINHWGWEKKYQIPSNEMTVFIHKVVDGKPVYKGKEKFSVLDDTQHYACFEILPMLNHLKMLCDSLNIPLAIINYYGFGDWVDDPLFLPLKDNLVVSNPKYGLYNELCWLGFDRPDNYHFDLEAHAWQADLLYNYFTKGTTIKVSTKNHPDLEYTDVYTYEDE